VLLHEGLSVKQAASLAAAITKQARHPLYTAALALKGAKA
jgi:hypothetical protein